MRYPEHNQLVYALALAHLSGLVVIYDYWLARYGCFFVRLLLPCSRHTLQFSAGNPEQLKLRKYKNLNALCTYRTSEAGYQTVAFVLCQVISQVETERI